MRELHAVYSNKNKYAAGSGDPDDKRILACARASGADYLATGDEDLLVIRQYVGTRILSARDFESLFAD
jgi:predicted nucleic acid-binding protein